MPLRTLTALAAACACILIALTASAQTQLSCSDVKSGSFMSYPPNGNVLSTIRTADSQRDINKKRRETIYWEVSWLNECTYALKYVSGAEQRTKAEQNILNRHKMICEILTVTEDYYTFRVALDKASNKTVANDTLWIKERRNAANKLTKNPRADSIAKARTINDTIKVKTATLYVYRPAKFLNALATYDLYFNEVAVATIQNGTRLQIQIPEGPLKIWAKVGNNESVVNLEVKEGSKYFLKCEAIHKLSYTLPQLTLMNAQDGKLGYDSK
jgi:hypothetical protein